MAFMILGIGAALLPLLLQLALKLRLGIPLLYSILMLTVFHSWYQAHAALADGILFAMVGIVILSWVVTLTRRLRELLVGWRDEWTTAWAFAGRVRLARLTGESAVSAEGLQWQPVIAYITATTPTGNPIITTEPKLITAPDGIEFSGNIPLHSNDGDTTLATTLETPAWQLIVIGDNDLRAACPDAAITLNVATILPRFDLSRTPAVIPRRRADDSAFCTVTLAPSRFSAAARPGPGRQAAIASAIATFDSSGVPKSTPRSYTSVMLSPPHSFIARHAAVAPGIVLWSDPTVSRALPPCASTFAAATGSVAWHAAVKVTFADGSSLVTATEGLDNAPLSFGPILSYPAPDAVSIHIIVKATGHPVRSGTFPLSPDPSRRRAIYIHSTLTPFTLPDTPAAYTIPAQQPAAVHFPGTIAAAPASAPLAPASLATLPAINALAAPTASQTAWDYGRSRFYAFTASGIHLLNVDLTKPRISTSAIDRRVVAAPCAVACCDDNIAAMNQAVKFIDDTRPAPEPETPAENVADATTAKSSDNSPKAPKS